MESERKNLLKGYNMLLYFAGSMIMSEPTEECVVDLWTNGTLRRLPVSSSNPRFLKAASLLRDSCPDVNKCRQMLADDYYALLADNGLSLAPARASVYLPESNNSMAVEKEVAEFYNSYGWKPGQSGKYADYLGVELLFLTKLVDKFLVLDDDPSCCEMKKEMRRFIDNYLLSWIPAWDKDIQKHANTLSYKGISTLIYACIEDLNEIFSSAKWN